MKPIFSNKGEQEILSNIAQYKKVIMNDISLSLRLTANERTYVTKLVEWEKETLIFDAPISKLNYVVYPDGSKLQTVFVSRSGLYMTEITVNKHYIQDGSVYYVGTITQPITKNQQREAFRLDVLLNVHYEILNGPTGHPIANHEGTSVNISTGGMCLNSNEKLASNTPLILSFKLVDTTFKIRGTVLATGEKNDVGLYTHRVQFCELSNAEIDSLSRVIFEKQRQQIKLSN